MKPVFQLLPDEFVSKTEFFDYKKPISEAFESIKKNGAVVVMKDNDYYGIVDDRAIARNSLLKLPSGYALGKVARPLHYLDSSYDIEKAATLFYKSSSKALPFATKGRITGIVHRMDILKALLSLHALSQFKVNEGMSAPVETIDENATLTQAHEQMKRSKVNRLIVMDNSRPYGVLTSRGIMLFGMVGRQRQEKTRKSLNPDTMKVRDICDRRVNSIEHDGGIDGALRSMIGNRTSALLVTRSGKPVGVITARDILELFVRNAQERRSRIVISGLDEDTKEYEDELNTYFKDFAERIDKFHAIKVGFIAANVKRLKPRLYEVRIRIGLPNMGAISAHDTGYTLESTVNGAIDRAYKEVKVKKEMMLYTRKV
ncbi:MAG: CBS domain-containing protein [Candidatus Micrarchaeota archaeon]|nr:CBS domain-containing protein [Candidatus Micrarchaeota archaeon]MDE1824592.1 CBS domain-containing protein [Candidatus Micrarchaeota archaeon]